MHTKKLAIATAVCQVLLICAAAAPFSYGLFTLNKPFWVKVTMVALIAAAVISPHLAWLPSNRVHSTGSNPNTSR